MTGPYFQAADAYWKAGWRGILPLPAKAKLSPPSGFTGSGGVYPSYADIFTWMSGREAAGNIALRMPPGVIGLDVDAYGDKPGAETLTLAEAAHGALPDTWRTTSRDDGISGIRFYRVPEGLAWPGEIGNAVEVIQARHRYALVSPSLHPEGRTYRWIGPDCIVSTTLPDPDDLPTLPEAWVAAYTGGALAVNIPRTDVRKTDAIAWIAGHEHSTATMCDRMEKSLDQFSQALAGSAHNSTRDATLRIARLADEGHHGAVHALADVRRRFIADCTSANRSILGKTRRTEAEAVYEFSELVATAVGIVIASPAGMDTCDCYGQLTNLVTSPTDGANALAPQLEPHVVETAPDPEPDSLRRMVDGASFILDAPTEIPNIWGDGDECLWAEGEALMICGPPGVGKTTLTGQVLRGLLGLEDEVLGLPVRQSSKRVLYLAMDRPAQIRRGLRRAFHETERDILATNLRFWEGPPPGDVARHPDVLLSLAHLAEADVVIIDSIKDAAVGLTEDEVAAAYNRARQTCLANHVQVLELHHMVKRGANGSKPTELADVYGSAWLTAGAGSVVLLWGAAGDPIVSLTHLKQPAAEVGPWRLEHDHSLGKTTIFHAADLYEIVAAGGSAGVTELDVARLVFESEKPTDAERKKARRKLQKLVDSGIVERFDTQRAGQPGGKPQAYYKVSSTNGHTNAAAIGDWINDVNGRTTPQVAVSPGQSNGHTNAANAKPGPMPSVPPSIEGDAEAPTFDPEIQYACNGCFRPVTQAQRDHLDGYCNWCAHERGLL